MRVMLITPPMTQLNTPYPATAYLHSYLQSKNISSQQKDFGIELICELFSKKGLQKINKEISLKNKKTFYFKKNFKKYLNTVEPIKKYLQGNSCGIQKKLSERLYAPEGGRFTSLNSHPRLQEIFYQLSADEKAKYVGSLYFDDIADVIKWGIDDKFEFSRYGEKLASSQTSFSSLYKEVLKSNTLIDKTLFEITKKEIDKYKPNVIALTAPFPGNVYGALKIAHYAKKINPKIKTIMGGGFTNTELRELSDKRFFEFIDFLVFDDGERPLELIIEYISGKKTEDELLRTWFLKDKKIIRKSNPLEHDIPFKNLLAPSYRGLDFKKYISMIEMPNPMHRLWTEHKWNKMILAHGCYWKKCTFCDITLDYIKRFEPQKAATIVDQMEQIIKETGQTGFHFVDEAAPPAILKQISEEIIKRNLKVTFWGNIRFDSLFTKEVCELMKKAGCIAVTGGLEVASPRLLQLINKGVTIEQVSRVTKNFKDAGIYTHAYLMYGFPSQTVQETVDSLEVVRQLFKKQCLDSAYWHRFVATVHSPVGQNPDNFKIKIHRPKTPSKGLFAINEVPFFDPMKVDHEILGKGLNFALYNYMHGIGIDADVREWFDIRVPKATSLQFD